MWEQSTARCVAGMSFDIPLGRMTQGERYRAKAVEFDARAQVESDASVRRDLENLAGAYRRLAQQADQNAGLDIAVELPPRKTRPDEEPSV